MSKKICFAGFADEELSSLTQAMGALSGAWDCVFAKDGPAALDTVSKGGFDAMVANMRMTGITGAELLHRLGDSHPKMLRFIIGDVADQSLIINCIGGTHQFIARPWQPQELISGVQRGLALDAWLSSDALRKIAPRLRRLPSLPSTYFELLKQIESPNTSVQTIGEVIARDPAVTVRLLQVVNSAAYALAQKVTDPLDAVSLLGLDTVKSLVLCMQVFSQTDQAKNIGVSMERLWEHSFTVGSFAREITLHETNDARLANDAFTAGLLHDVGRIVLASNLPKEYASVVVAARRNKRPLHEEEVEQLGVSHAQVGAYLLGLWGMPAGFVEVAALHHLPSESPEHEFSLLTAVHAANVFAHEQESNAEVWPQPQLDLDYLKGLKMVDHADAWRKVVAGEDAAPAEFSEASEPSPEPTSEANQDVAPDYTPAQPESRWAFNFLAPALVVVMVLAVIGWWATHSSDTELKVKAASKPAEQGKKQPARVAGKETAPRPDSSATQTVAATDSPRKSAETNTPQKPVIEAEAHGFDTVKVQGVFYRRANSSVIINGQTLGIGDRINEVEVMSISPTSVVLMFQGEHRGFDVK